MAIRPNLLVALVTGALLSMATSAAAAVSPGSIVFDFDSLSPGSPLPVQSTQGGITAQLSATGQGYSIQVANVLGFTPVGFSGLVVYPSSVYLADLLIAFDAVLTDFSIMYAPEEYGCDSSATLRLTAYRAGSFVATSTATAPVPGTWPTGELTLSAAQGFDHVVIHYDAPPPTGGDWGPIFMADNMTVTAQDAIFANGFE